MLTIICTLISARIRRKKLIICKFFFSVDSSRETVQRITPKKDSHSTVAMDTIEERKLEFLALTKKN